MALWCGVMSATFAASRTSSIGMQARNRDPVAHFTSTHEDGLRSTTQQAHCNKLNHWTRNAGNKKPVCRRIVAQKRANLFVKSDRVVQLPDWVSSAPSSRTLGAFLQLPEGMQSVLNIKSLKTMQPLGDNTYRCTLPELEFLNFTTRPIIDLYVATTDNDCIVEMLSCKFEGSDEVERQNKRFSASMKNHLTWDSSTSLNVKVELKLSLEIYTFPFTHLPASAVEVPANAILQAFLDRMMPAFVDYLLEDYKRWAVKDSPGNRVINPPELALEELDCGTVAPSME